MGGMCATAAADEFAPIPQLSVGPGCKSGVYKYDVHMQNLGNDFTHFDIVVDLGDGTGPVAYGYDVAGGGSTKVTFVLPEGNLGSFVVTNVDDPTVTDTFTVTADCLGDPYTEANLVCPDDGTAPFVYLQWVNLSYKNTVHFVVSFGGVVVYDGNPSGPNNPFLLSYDLANGDHATASITADGATMEDIDTIVDCPVIITTTTTTSTSSTTTSSTLPAGESTVPTSDVIDQIPATPDHDGSVLPVTGRSDRGLVTIGIGLLLAGGALIRFTRRLG